MCRLIKIIFTLTLTGVFCLNTNHLNAQRIRHSIGISVGYMHADENIFNVNSRNFVTTALSYFPHYVIASRPKTSFTIGVPANAVLGFGTNVVDADNIMVYGVELPVAFDLNFGAKSTKDNRQKYGAYIGAGFSYSQYAFILVEDHVYNKHYELENSYGPLFRAGTRIGFSFGGKRYAASLGLYYKDGFENENFRNYGLSILIDL